MQSQQLRVEDAHPDPDLLTAFAEQSLTPRERQQVLVHLANCTECREVITLAGSVVLEPELAAAAAGRSPVAKTGKSVWSWRPLRWTAAAATAAVVLSAVWLNQKEPARQFVAPISETTPSIAQPRSEPASAPGSSSGDPKAGTQAAAREESSHALLAVDTLASPAPPRAMQGAKASEPAAAKLQTSDRGALAEKKLDANELAKQKVILQLPVNGRETARLDQLQAPKAVPSQAVGGPMRSMAGVAARRDYPAETATNAPAPAAAAPPVTMTYSRKVAADLAPASAVAEGKANAESSVNLKQNVTVSKDEQESASPAELQKMASGQNVESEMQPKSSSDNSVAIVNPWWRVTQQGQLQKSFDGGRTWQSVFGESVAKFRAVASLDAVVWAGGDNGDFWSSTNGGKTWRRDVANVDGHSPKGQVTKIALPNPATVVITTDAGETWTSTNGGLNWTVKYD